MRHLALSFRAQLNGIVFMRALIRWFSVLWLAAAGAALAQAPDATKRGTLEVGKLADLAVRNRDYLTVPADQIAALDSLLTMVGGRVVYADGPYKQFE